MNCFFSLNYFFLRKHSFFYCGFYYRGIKNGRFKNKMVMRGGGGLIRKGGGGNIKKRRKGNKKERKKIKKYF